jgi:hypothetical protein
MKYIETGPKSPFPSHIFRKWVESFPSHGFKQFTFVLRITTLPSSNHM